VRTEGQALVHLLVAASLEGVAVRGPMVGAEHCYVHVADWLGERPAVDRERALAELARRYLPAPLMLGAFDPVLLGWCSRETLVGANQTIVTINGIFRPFALVRGRAVAVWSIAAAKVTLKPFVPIAAADERKLLADGERALRYLGLTRASRTASPAA